LEFDNPDLDQLEVVDELELMEKSSNEIFLWWNMGTHWILNEVDSIDIMKGV